MKVCDLSQEQLTQALASGLKLRIGSFWFELTSTLPPLIKHISLLYPQCTLDQSRSLIDFPIAVMRQPGVRRWFKPLAQFWFNGAVPFTPLALNQAPALAEWGINWCVSAHAHHYLIIHAAVVARHNKAIVLPAASGSGKSTLCAALVSRGWRLLSDEYALLRLADGRLQPFVKPISLKNQSIPIIREYWPQGVMGDICHDTQKGSVAHLRPPADSVLAGDECAQPVLWLFPRYVSGAPVTLTPEHPALALVEVVKHAFNYHLLGVQAFQPLAQVMQQSQTYRLQFGQLDDALAQIEQLLP